MSPIAALDAIITLACHLWISNNISQRFLLKREWIIQKSISGWENRKMGSKKWKMCILMCISMQMYTHVLTMQCISTCIWPFKYGGMGSEWSELNNKLWLGVFTIRKIFPYWELPNYLDMHQYAYINSWNSKYKWFL